MVVYEDEDEEEGGKEKEKANLPTSLDQALATAFSLNSANSNVSATASTSAQAQGSPEASGSTRRRHTRGIFERQRKRGDRHHVTDKTLTKCFRMLMRRKPRTITRLCHRVYRRAGRGNDAMYTHR